MTDDIVIRLRTAAFISESGGGEWYQLIYRCREAADEIERLRVENRRLDAECNDRAGREQMAAIEANRLCTENAEMLDLIIDLVSQACDRDGELDSMAISTYADALLFLADKSKIVIESEAGRRVVGRWAE